MPPFLEDPRLRQRWNQISHNAEAATENAAASIWTFQHTYITPCLGSVGDALDACTAVCLGDRDERARRRRGRERERGQQQQQQQRGRHGGQRTLAEYSFDFYDDWYDDLYEDDALEEGSDGDVDQNAAGAATTAPAGSMRSLFSRGFFGSWRGSRAEDWDRLLAGSGSGSGRGGRHYDGDDEGGDPSDNDGHEGTVAAAAGEVVDQPRRKRGMSYNTHPVSRGHRRKTAEGEDPTIIPSTAPLGFLGRLPFKIGGPLRYKPSAANLRVHPTGGHHTRDENEPLLGGGGGGVGGGGGKNYDRYGTAAMTMAPVSSSTAARHSKAAAAAGHARSIDGADADAEAAAAYYDDDTTTPPPAATPTRNRSSTVGSGDTSDSYRSRGDLFPSDEEDDEDAVPLDDEFAVALGRVDDRSSGRTRFSSSSSVVGAGILQKQRQKQARTGTGNGKGKGKGERRGDMGASCASLVSMASMASNGSAGSGTGTGTGTGSGPRPIRKGVLSRSVSRTTIDSVAATSARSAASSSIRQRLSMVSLGGDDVVSGDQDMHQDDVADQLRREDERVAREEDEAVERRRQAAVRLARERGLDLRDDEEEASPARGEADTVEQDTATVSIRAAASPPAEFIPARLPRFS